MIRFKSLVAKNFLSIGNIPYRIDFEAGTTLLIGHNGKGKSIVNDCLLFVLYDKSFRKVNKPQLVNLINKKNCVVELDMEANGKSYHVVRGIAPLVFQVIENGKLVDSFATASDLQAWFESTVLRMSLQTFRQVCILGSADYTPFMKLTATQRREVSEQLTDTTIISEMSKILKERISTHMSEMKSTATRLEMSKSNLVKLEAMATADLEKKRHELQTYAEEGIKLAGRRKTLAEDIAQQKELEHQIMEASLRVSELNRSISTIESRINMLKGQIKFFDAHESCPTCKQAIAPTHADQIRHSIGACIQTETETGTEEAKKIEAIEVGLVPLNVGLAQKKAKERELIEVTTKLQSIKSFMTALSSEINSLSSVESGFLETARHEVDVFQSQLDALREESAVHEAAQKLLKDNGIKASIVKQYIPVLNAAIAKYLQAFDFFATFSFDETFEDQIAGGTKDFTYGNLSMGQRQRVDLAMLFAWRDVARQRSRVDTNLIIFDETLDMSLDVDGIDSVLAILEKLTAGTCVIIISHRETLIDKVNRTIKVEMQNGFTRLVSSS